MTDAPEKVFAWPSADGRGWYAGGCSYEPTMTFEDIEYIRADLVDAQDAAWAERVAALEAAVAAARAEGMREAAKLADDYQEWCANWGEHRNQVAADAAAKEIAAAIRAEASK